MKSALRHLQRQCVLQALFAKDQFQEGAYANFIDYAIEEFGQELPNSDFAYDLFNRCNDFQEKAFKLIQEFAPDWPVDKIAPVDRNVLLIGITELCTDSEVPKLVALNEAIELAKDFGDESSSKFINAVLSNIAKDRLKLDLETSKPQTESKTKSNESIKSN